MPILIHLNGPSGVGKSTLGQRYADEHPGVLNLDADVVLSLIGGSSADFFRFVTLARNLSVAMAGAHLRSGYNVVLPQLVTSIDEAMRFEAAASDAHARYAEVALLVDPEEQVERFRSKSERRRVAQQVAQAVAAHGGDDLLRKINRDFLGYLDRRPTALRLATSGAERGTTYERLLALLPSTK